MYKLHKILQRFLCRIPIDSKSGAPGSPTRLCATMCVYLYLYPSALPYPCLPTYMHVYIIVYVCDDVCVYLIVFVFALFSLLLSLSLLLFSLFFFSCSLSLPWQGLPLGRGSRSLALYIHKFFILFNYQPGVCMYSVYTCISL